MKSVKFPLFRNVSRIQHQYVRYTSTSVHGNNSLTIDEDNIKPFSAMPGPNGMPYFGTLYQYRFGPYAVDDYHRTILKRFEKYGDIFKETISGHTVVHLLNPEYIKVMYASEDKTPHIPPLLETTQMYRKYRDMSPGLGNTNGEEWYRLRTNINQMMMRPKAVTMYLPSVNKVTDDFINHLQRIIDNEAGIVRSLHQEIRKWTLESSAMTCFEKRLFCFDAKSDSFQMKMIEASQKIFILSRKLRFSIPFYKVLPQLSPTWKKLIEAEDFFFVNGQKLVDETVKKIEHLLSEGNLEEDSYGFLRYILGKKELSYKDISIITLSLFSDGLSTTSPTTVGQLYCLAKNKQAQDRLFEEVREIAPNPDEPISADMINKASYLKACLKEGFRFFPIGSEISRIPQSDIVIGGYKIPAGTHIELNNNMLLRRPEYFEDPDTYLPERWLRGGSGHNIHPYLLLPFGFGPRTCAGRCFAEQEMFVIIMKLLQRFELSWPHNYEVSQRYNILLTPDKDAAIQFKLRQKL